MEEDSLPSNSRFIYSKDGLNMHIDSDGYQECQIVDFDPLKQLQAAKEQGKQIRDSWVSSSKNQESCFRIMKDMYPSWDTTRVESIDGEDTTEGGVDSKANMSNTANYSDWGREDFDDQVPPTTPAKIRRALSWEMGAEKVECERKIAEGFFGEVFEGRWRSERVAVKRFKQVRRGGLDNFRKELTVLSRLRHPRVVQFLGACVSTDPGCPFLVTEFMEGGSLTDLVGSWRKGDPDAVSLSGAQKLRILRDIASGLQYLHCADPPIAHRDLTSSNCLLDRHLRAKLSDFGLSRLLSDSLSQRHRPINSSNSSSSSSGGGSCGGSLRGYVGETGNLYYAAPEVLRGEPATVRSDIYSFSIVATELWSGCQGLAHIPVDELLLRVCGQGERPSLLTPCHHCQVRLLPCTARQLAPPPPAPPPPTSKDAMVQTEAALLAGEEGKEEIIGEKSRGGRGGEKGGGGGCMGGISFPPRLKSLLERCWGGAEPAQMRARPSAAVIVQVLDRLLAQHQ